MKWIEITKESHFDSIEFRDDWWVNSIWLWLWLGLWCVENDISHRIIWCIANTRWWIRTSNSILIIWLSAQFINIFMLLLVHTGQSVVALFYFKIISLEKKRHDKWLKNSNGTHFDLIHQIRFLKLNAKFFEQNRTSRNENEAASLCALLRKAV